MGLFGNNPDFAKVEESRNHIMYLDTRLREIKESEAKAARTVKKALDAFVYDELREMLESIDVEEVNRDKEGIRVQLLKDAGINNIWQLENQSVNSLTLIRGVGEQMALKIRKNADKIAEKAHASLHIQLTADDFSPEAENLKRALYITQKLMPLQKAAKEFYSAAHEAILGAYALSEPASGRLKWLFASSEKKKIALERYDSINSLLYGAFGNRTNELIGRFEQVISPAPEQWRSDFEQNSPNYFATLERLGDGKVTGDAMSFGLSEEMTKAIGSVELNLTGLKCTLRAYQMFGVQYVLLQGNVLLGDEMGLGKTVQAIGAMVAIRNSGGKHFAVVCPASVIENWCRELVKHSDLKPFKLHGGESKSVIENWKNEGGVLVTNFESLAKFRLDHSFNYSMLVVDEAHYVKNPEAQRTKNLLLLRKSAERVLFMTGTPLENKVEEMQFLIGCLNPAIAKRIEELKSLSEAPVFREIIAPVYFRRTREEVLKELPALSEAEEWCELTMPERKSYYSAVVNGNFMDMRQVSWKFDGYSVNSSSKATRLVELCREAGEEGRKLIVFSYFLKTLEKVMEALGTYTGEDYGQAKNIENGYGVVSGNISGQKEGNAGLNSASPVNGTDAQVKGPVQNGKPAQDRRIIGPVTGSISPEKRQELVDEFTNAPAGSVLVAQIQAGGTGLNIQAASVVVLCEPQLKPSIENQAISRAYRMGQVRNVLVYRLLCEDTVDEQIMKILAEKQRLFDNFADKSVAAVDTLEVDENTQKAILEMEQQRVRREQEEAEENKKKKEWEELQKKYEDEQPDSTDDSAGPDKKE